MMSMDYEAGHLVSKEHLRPITKNAIATAHQCTWYLILHEFYRDMGNFPRVKTTYPGFWPRLVAMIS